MLLDSDENRFDGILIKATVNSQGGGINIVNIKDKVFNIHWQQLTISGPVKNTNYILNTNLIEYNHEQKK